MKKKINYKYYSGNDQNLQKLHSLVGNYHHAVAIDKFAFLSINSIFTLDEDSPIEGWFKLTYKKLGSMVGYAERTIKSLVKKFTALNLIETLRTQNGTCIRVTNKCLNILGLQSQKCEQPDEVIEEKRSTDSTSSQISKNLEHKCTLKVQKVSSLHYKDNNKENIVNNITRLKASSKCGKLYNLPPKIQILFTEIGERLEEEQKATLWGTVNNLQKQDGLSFNPYEITAWFAFSLINSKHQLNGIEGFSKQLSVLAKKVREGSYRRPIGFHNHWDIGVEMRNKAAEKRKQQQREKIEEVLVARKSSANVFESSCTDSAIQLRMSQTPDGEYAFEDVGRKKSTTREISLLKKERNSIVRDLNNTKNEVASLERMLKSPTEGNLGFMAKVLKRGVMDDQRKKRTLESIAIHKQEITQYQQALKEIDANLTEMTVKLKENHPYEEAYVGLYEEMFA